MTTAENASSSKSGPVLAEREDRVWAWTALEVTAAYDLSRLADLARLPPDGRLEHAIHEQSPYIDRLLALRVGEVVALRWLSTGQGRLHAWLLGRVHAPTPVAATNRARDLTRHLGDVPGQVEVKAVEQTAKIQEVLAPFEPAVGGLAQVAKRLRIQEPERADAGIATYLAVEPFGQAAEDWGPLLQVLAAHPCRLTLTITVTPQHIPVALRRTLESEATRYAHLREPLDMPADVGGWIRYPPDSGAAVMEALYRDTLHRYTGLVFRYAATVASPRPFDDMLVEAVGRTFCPSSTLLDRRVVGLIGGAG